MFFADVNSCFSNFLLCDKMPIIFVNVEKTSVKAQYAYVALFILYLNTGNWNHIGVCIPYFATIVRNKTAKSQVRCGKMRNRVVKRHLVNDHNSFAGIIQQTP